GTPNERDRRSAQFRSSAAFTTARGDRPSLSGSAKSVLRASITQWAKEVMMRDLIVVGFQGTHRAAEVLHQVLDLNADWAVDLHLEDAVAVYRTRDGKLRVDESMQPTSKEGAAWGGAVGALIGSLIALPFTGGAGGAGVAAGVGASVVTRGA